jgi:hypothetical protein
VRDACIKRWIKFVSFEHAEPSQPHSGTLGSTEERDPLLAATFYKRSLGLHDAHVEFLEWSDAAKTKRTKELEKKYLCQASAHGESPRANKPHQAAARVAL